MNNKKILVIQTAFLGDVILTTGILEKLHKKYPQAQIDLLIKKGYTSLFSKHPFINQVLTFDKTRKIKEISRLISIIQDAYYDIVINTHRHLSSGIFTVRSGAGYKIGYDKNPMSFFYDVSIPYKIPDGRHEYERLHDLIKNMTDAEPHKPVLYVDEHIPDLEMTRPYICVAPNSMWFTKTYPVDRWISFMGKIPEQTPIYLVGGPDESDLFSDIIQKTNRGEIINTAGKITMLQSIHLMKHAIMNYTNDSGPLHMASAVNAPAASLFLSTSPKLGFGPISDQHIVLETRNELSCKPCGNHGHRACPQGHFLCSDISEDQLLSVLK